MLLAFLRRYGSTFELFFLNKDVALVRLVLPYLRVSETDENFQPADMNKWLRKCIALSDQRPCYLEISDGTRQCYLFLREKQIYSAGMIETAQCSDITIRDFLSTTSQMRSPTATCCEVNSKILHSLLILFQKKPGLKLLTSLVDLDEVLDKIEEEGKSCIVSATQGAFLAVLRYEKGEVTALCHEASLIAPKEASFREDFLVKIYTLSAETPISINIYEDLLVKYAADAKAIEDGYKGDIADSYLSKPPTVTLEFKGKEIGRWVLDKPVLNIGRTEDNDIVIDNLAVSRLHAILERDKGHYFIKDCDSLNGTLLNGKKVGRGKLEHGDEIIIGKHELKISKQSGKGTPLVPNVAALDQTVIITAGQKPPAMPPQMQSTENSGPRLVERTKAGDVVVALSKSSLVFGKDNDADIEIEGMLVAKQHAEITRENGHYVLKHLNGRRKVSVGGKPVKECVLRNNDAIKIGKREFIFQE